MTLLETSGKHWEAQGVSRRLRQAERPEGRPTSPRTLLLEVYIGMLKKTRGVGRWYWLRFLKSRRAGCVDGIVSPRRAPPNRATWWCTGPARTWMHRASTPWLCESTCRVSSHGVTTPSCSLYRVSSFVTGSCMQKTPFDRRVTQLWSIGHQVTERVEQRLLRREHANPEKTSSSLLNLSLSYRSAFQNTL